MKGESQEYAWLLGEFIFNEGHVNCVQMKKKSLAHPNHLQEQGARCLHHGFCVEALCWVHPF